MAATFQNNGLHPMNLIILGAASSAAWVLHLFDNVITPAVTDTVGSYTECANSTYAAVTLTGGTWSGSATAGTDTETYPTITFNFASFVGSDTVYGGYVTITVSSTTYLLCSQNFASSYAIPNGGGALAVNATETLT